MVRVFENARKGVEIKLPNDTYLATIKDVSDGEYKEAGATEGQPQYLVDFVLDEVENEDGTPIQLRYYLTIPDGLLDVGVVSPRSNLYSFMKAMGEDPDADQFRVDPNRWTNKKARIVVENKVAKSGANAGKERPVITNVWPPSSKSGGVKPKAPSPGAAPQPVAASAGGDDSF